MESPYERLLYNLSYTESILKFLAHELVHCAAESVPDRTKAHAELGPSIFVAGARFELATFGL
jgi:hypothetical protein